MPLLGRVFKIESQPPALIVSPQGAAINFQYKEVHAESNGLLEEFQRGGYRHVVIDLSGVDYVDSIIIGALIRVLQKAKTGGGLAVFCCASENMQEVLACIKIGTLWPLYESREAALAALPAAT